MSAHELQLAKVTIANRHREADHRRLIASVGKKRRLVRQRSQSNQNESGTRWVPVLRH